MRTVPEKILNKEETQFFITQIKMLIKKLREHHQKIPSSLVGTLGEFQVYKNILDKDSQAQLLSGQSGADIKLTNCKRIEVKTATFNKNYKLWGFGKIRPNKFDYLICVALDEELEPEFIIFTKDEAIKLPTEEEATKGITTRFKQSEIGIRTFHRFKPEHGIHQKSETLLKINSEIDRYRDWGKINRIGP